MQANRRNTVTLVLGGVRSGKSHYAQQLGEQAGRVVFLATAQASDDEMRRKIDRHRSIRPQHWQTVEESLGLAEAIVRYGISLYLMIINRLTLFAASLLEALGDDKDANDTSVAALCLALQPPPCSVVL